MKRIMALLLTLALGTTLAQVATAVIVGVDETLPRSPGISGVLWDESVGEKAVRVRALDDAGNPVAEVPVTWTVRNRGEDFIYIVGSSVVTGHLLIRVRPQESVTVDGGVTGEDGTAFLVVDAQTEADAMVGATVGGIQARGYDESDMRITWF